MENFENVRGHICDQMHSWYTDDGHVIPTCPFCNLPPWKTSDPCDLNSESVSIGGALNNLVATAITTSHEEDFLKGSGWARNPKFKYWELVILARFESLQKQLTSKSS